MSLAHVLNRQGDLSGALASLERALDLGVDDESEAAAYELKCEILDALKRPDEEVAEAYFEAGRKLDGSDNDHRILAEFFTLTCLEIIKREPSVLLGEAQASVYLASLATLTNGLDLPPTDPNWLRPILADVLDLKISIADQRTADSSAQVEIFLQLR